MVLFPGQYSRSRFQKGRGNARLRPSLRLPLLVCVGHLGYLVFKYIGNRQARKLPAKKKEKRPLEVGISKEAQVRVQQSRGKGGYHNNLGIERRGMRKQRLQTNEVSPREARLRYYRDENQDQLKVYYSRRPEEGRRQLLMRVGKLMGESGRKTALSHSS